MATFIRHRERVETVHHSLNFDYPHERGSGFSFPCDEQGQVDRAALSPSALANLACCERGVIDATSTSGYRGPIVAVGVQTSRSSYWLSSWIRCERCRCSVELHDPMTNTCERCGTDYNGSGQMLAARSCWGEETGETAADLLRGWAGAAEFEEV